MDFRTKVEQLTKQGRLVFLKTTRGDYVGRMKGFHPKNVNNIDLIPVDILSFSRMHSLEIPIGTIEEISTIVDGKIAGSFKA